MFMHNCTTIIAVQATTRLDSPYRLTGTAELLLIVIVNTAVITIPATRAASFLSTKETACRCILQTRATIFLFHQHHSLARLEFDFDVLVYVASAMNVTVVSVRQQLVEK